MEDVHSTRGARRRSFPPFTVLILGVVVTAVVVLVVLVGVSMLRHNTVFNEWKAPLVEHEAPPGMAMVESGSRFGLIWGNGNHCDAEAWVLLSGDLGSGEIRAHYSAVDDLIVRPDGDLWRVSIEQLYLTSTTGLTHPVCG